MSLIGSMSGSPTCMNCGAGYGHNSCHLRVREWKHLGDGSYAAYTGSTFGNGPDGFSPDVALVCDECLFAALRVAFGHLLKQKGAQS